VVASDAPGLLAAIAAAITANRLEVLGAQVYSRTRLGAANDASVEGGRALASVEGEQASAASAATARALASVEAVDLFWVRDARAGSGGVPQAMPRLVRDLESVVTGAKDAAALLRDRIGTSSPWRERPSPAVVSEVVVDDRASPRHTVIEVFAKDRPGLLYSLARALTALGLDIALSKINTEGTKVADVFYVNEAGGGAKVEPGPRFKAIREALLDAIDASDESGTSRVKVEASA
jgi:[protein-PII] uridylyltransferase